MLYVSAIRSSASIAFRLVRGYAVIETAVADDHLGPAWKEPLVRFYRGAEYEGDATVWFVPSVTALLDWCRSSGLTPTVLATWSRTWVRLARDSGSRPPFGRTVRGGRRCMVRVERTRGEPEFKGSRWAEGALRVSAE